MLVIFIIIIIIRHSQNGAERKRSKTKMNFCNMNAKNGGIRIRLQQQQNLYHVLLFYAGLLHSELSLTNIS